MHRSTRQRLSEEPLNYYIVIDTKDVRRIRERRYQLWECVACALRNMRHIPDHVIVFMSIKVYFMIRESALMRYDRDHPIFVRNTMGPKSSEDGDRYIRSLFDGPARLAFRTAVCLEKFNLAERIRRLKGLDVNVQSYRCPMSDTNGDSNILEDSILQANRFNAVNYLIGIGAKANMLSALALKYASGINLGDRDTGRILHLTMENPKLDVNAKFAYCSILDGPIVSIVEFLACGKRTAELIQTRKLGDRLTIGAVHSPPQSPYMRVDEETIQRCFSVLVFLVMRWGYWIETKNMPTNTRQAINALQRTMFETLPVEIRRHVSHYLM